MNPIEAYVSATSVYPGGSLGLHVRTEARSSTCAVVIARWGEEERVVANFAIATTNHPTPANAYEVGCGWPAATTLSIPAEWSSGVYVAHVTSSGNSTDVFFVVKAARNAQRQKKILMQLCAATYAAYNSWGGRSTYTNPRATKVSLQRPLSSDSYGIATWELPFIAWMERNGFEADYCTSVDLHAEPRLLGDYQLLLSVGHDEYWSWEMRDHVESFVRGGGNVAFFGGNLCWWQIRFENNNRTMVCYKDAAMDLAENPTLDPRRATINWLDSSLGRRENHLSGVSFQHGAGWWRSAKPAEAYRVRFARHWVFESTGLGDGDEFGREDLIVGYEADAALFQEINGVPQVTGADETPANFLVLASADLTHWGPGGWSGGYDGQDPTLGRGKATLGLFRKRGTVFTAATTDWAFGLHDSWNAVAQITSNVLTRLSCPCPPSPRLINSAFEQWSDVPWQDIGPAAGADVVTMATANGKLFCVTADFRLWQRDVVGVNAAWQHIGEATNVSALTVANGKLYATTRNNRLLWRDVMSHAAPLEDIGAANNIVALAATTDRLFAAASNDRLWWREPIGQGLLWTAIGRTADFVAMAVSGRKHFAVSSNNRLWWRDAVTENSPWLDIGHANHVKGMAATNDKLFVVTSDGRLWSRDPVGLQFDGWSVEGTGRAYREAALVAAEEHYCITLNARSGQVWVSQAGFDCEGHNYYRIGCWVKASGPGATIRLQSTHTWNDFIIAEHSGADRWEYLCGVGRLDNEGPLVPSRVKFQVAEGTVALFGRVEVDAL